MMVKKSSKFGGGDDDRDGDDDVAMEQYLDKVRLKLQQSESSVRRWKVSDNRLKYVPKRKTR